MFESRTGTSRVGGASPTIELRWLRGSPLASKVLLPRRVPKSLTLPKLGRRLRMEGEVRETVEDIPWDRKERREGLVGRVGDMG